MVETWGQLSLPGLEVSGGGDLISGLAGKDAVFALDVHFLLRQVFHAIPDIRGPRGQPVAAVVGFMRDIANLLRIGSNRRIVCAFDTPLEQNFRRRLFPGYKASREKMPEDLRLQLTTVRELLTALSIPILEYPAYEADDVLATVAEVCKRRRVRCLLVTGDKDCRQLISDDVQILDLRKRTIFDADSLHRAWGIAPEQVADYQALVGDSVDDVPGVPSIGPKTAQELLARYTTLDEVLANVDAIPGLARREKLRQARESVLVLREVVTLVDSLPIDVPLDGNGSPSLLFSSLCKGLGLESLADEVISSYG